MHKKNIGLILARAGSKGLKNKNLLKLSNFNLIEWAYYAAKDTNFIDQIVISTNYSKNYFKDLDIVYYKRPEILCTDKATSYDAILNAIEYIEKKIVAINSITLLEPPCPFRNGKLLNKVFDFFNNHCASSVVTIKKVDDFHPIRMKKLGYENLLTSIHRDFEEPSKGLPRQLQNDIYIRDTAVYMFDPAHLKNNYGSLYGNKPIGFINNSITSNIDSKIDYLFCSNLIDQYLKGKINIEIPTFIKKQIKSK